MNFALNGTEYLSSISFSGLPVNSLQMVINLIFPFSLIRTIPSSSQIVATPLGFLASKSSCTRGRPCVISPVEAIPPVWKVRIVSCVPGSPIDCAAIVPTASPICTGLPVAIFFP